MKHVKFTYVDSVTGVPISQAPAVNGPRLPDIPGLQFVWARESAYPVDVPEFFGTVPDDYTPHPAVLKEYSEEDFNVLHADELSARRWKVVPRSITQRQCRLQLLDMGLLSDVEQMIESLPSEAQISWSSASEIRREHPVVLELIQALGLTNEEADQMFISAGGR